MGDLDGLSLKPWAKQPGESDRAFHAFTHFLSLLPHERSMDRAYTNHMKLCKKHDGSPNARLMQCSPNWQDWRFKYSWVERAAFHDADIFERERLRRVHEIEEMNKRHTQISVALQNLVVERLQQAIQNKEVFNMNPVSMARLLDRAALVERRSRGEATAIIKHEGGESSQAMALDLSKLTDEELAVFQRLVEKADPSKTPTLV
jgi:hypothetical protein